MIGVGLETTERRRLEEQVRQAQKLESIGLLAGGVAHDFNNLLTGVLGNASLAMEVIPPSSPAMPLLDEVVCASERAADLTRQLLAYSGKGRFVIGPLDLSELAREISALLHVTLPKKVDLQLELAAGLPLIEADTSQIQQVMMNLVINGAEAIGDDPGRVVVRTGAEQVQEGGIADDLDARELAPGNYVYLEVRDTGCGFDAETRSRIFDPFFTTKFTGRGLGLAAVSGVVRSHRGAIRVASAPGQGSTFRVLFPAVTAAGSAVEAQDGATELPSAGLVLVVDDEDVVRRTARLSLERHGFTVLCAGDGLEGVELFRQNVAELALVLLDMTMPVLGGEQAVRIMKEIRSDVPVIASSGHTEMEASRRFDQGTLAGFIQKPYTAAALAGKVKAVLAAHPRRMRA
jgi:nitrogen-specific signal transduction histidine kinase